MKSLSSQLLIFLWFTILSQESAHEKNQKYKEGKFVLERYFVIFIFCSRYIFVRQFSYILYLVFNTYCAYLAYVDTYNRGRIVDDVDSSTEFYIDSHVSMSDGEDA